MSLKCLPVGVNFLSDCRLVGGFLVFCFVGGFVVIFVVTGFLSSPDSPGK